MPQLPAVLMVEVECSPSVSQLTTTTKKKFWLRFCLFHCAEANKQMQFSLVKDKQRGYFKDLLTGSFWTRINVMELKTSTILACSVLVPALFYLKYKFVMLDKRSATRNTSFVLVQLLLRRQAQKHSILY